jgi:AcrR family transcriptional regulator
VPAGRRARKKDETRRRIAEAAMALFLSRGFAATTLDDIAEAADISKRSFFDYFPSKEDVVLAWQDVFKDELVAEIAARPADEPLAVAAERAMVAAISRYDVPQARAHLRLRDETPALRARDHMKYGALEQAMSDALLKRPGAKRDPLRARLVAMIVVGALRIASSDGAPLNPSASARRIVTSLRAAIKDLI